MSYYRNKATGKEKILYTSISNGIILTDFTEEGHPLANSSMKLFVTKDDLNENWERFEFSPKLDPSEEEIKFLSKIIKHLFKELENRGMMFQNDMRLEEFTYCDGEYQIVDKLIRADFSQYKRFSDFYSQEIKRQLSSDDEFEYGLSLEDILVDAKVFVDSFRSVAKYYKVTEK
jgi:hypothetical protein